MSKDYYNTINESGPILKKSSSKAKKQKEQILAIYKHTLRPMTPAEIWESYGFKNNNTPLTSVRRAITNLEADGLLKKTNIQKPGLYGKTNFCWIHEPIQNNTKDQESLF